jgi:hypothetical protein
MSHYRFYLMDANSHIVDAIDHHASDDESALETARARCHDHTIEVWQADRRVGALTKDAPT